MVDARWFNPDRMACGNRPFEIGADNRASPAYIRLLHRLLALDGAYERRSREAPAAFLLIGRPSLRGKTAEDQRLLELLDPVAQSAGYVIVRLRLMGGDDRRTLQVMGERPDGAMLVEDCTVLAHAVSEVLDAADPIRGEYTLEVSSPGIDRPLTRLEDFETYAGYDARLELDRLVENRKRFKGVLAGVEDGQVAIDLEGEDETALVPFAWIAEANLVITDELMKRGADARAARVARETQEEESP